MSTPNARRLSQHPVAIVTGTGNPRGIGAATVLRLTAAGVRVLAAVGPGEAAPPEAAAAIRIDLSEPGAAGEILEAATLRLGEPASILVASAAHSTRDGFEALDADTLDAHYSVNLRSTALLAAGLCRELPADRAGRIVALTSGQTLGPMPGELAYGASKAAIESLVRTLAAEVGHLGVTVNAVNPGPTDTGWMDEPTRAKLLERFPMGRLGEADDAARLSAFLVSDDARWITGQIIASEGGFLRR
jgi:3-oxoacyl-[acyl-carrier protein] reductase